MRYLRGNMDSLKQTGPEDTGEQFKDPEEIIEVEFEFLRNWIAARKKMYDDNIERITDIYHYIIFKDSDEVVAVYYPVDGAGISVLQGVPAKEGSFFMGWKNDAGEYADLTEGVHENMILYADYADIDIVSKGQELYFLNDEAIDTEPSDVEPDDISLPTGDSFRGGILFMLLSLSVLLRRLGKWKKQ